MNTYTLVRYPGRLMQILLISTYELGHQPYHVASPAARLKEAGFQVNSMDLAVEDYDRDKVAAADAIAISVTMHTALRLGVDTATRIRAEFPHMPVAFYGLYAGVSTDRTVGQITDAVFIGEYEPGLLKWLKELSSGGRSLNLIDHNIAPMDFLVPDRSSLPPLDRYARLMIDGEARLSGYVEASHGCRHRCRHCPLPVVYDGRFRTVGAEVVLADISQQVDAGAQHITFGDPDFLNGPAYSLSILEEAHRSFPDITFDVTVKVEHILKLADRWSEFGSYNVLFVISAFESTDDRSLELLEKDHTCTDMVKAVDLLRSAGIEIRPTWLPFVPWAKPHHITDMFNFLAEHDLFAATDPVQMGLRLLIPEGSLVLEIGEYRHLIEEYDADALTYRWRSEDPQMDILQPKLMQIASKHADWEIPTDHTLTEQWALTLEEIGSDPSAAVVVNTNRSVPSLSESWFCCAEPTELQTQRVTVPV